MLHIAFNINGLSGILHHNSLQNNLQVFFARLAGLLTNASIFIFFLLGALPFPAHLFVPRSFNSGQNPAR